MRGWTRASDGRVISNRALDEAIARDHAEREARLQKAAIRARWREEAKAKKTFVRGYSRIRPQKFCESPALRHCCDRFYAQVDYDIRMWDREEALKLGIRQVVEEVEREKRHRRQMRALIREELIRRGAL